MIKKNPLFVDSTKFQGDNIPTNIELTKVLPYPDELVFIKIQEPNGEEKSIQLQPDADYCFSAKTWLRHQQEITYQFYIARNNEVLFCSRPNKTCASYLIAEEWPPLDICLNV